MKYTILGFSQEKLTEFGLDLKDAMILRWFVDFYHTGKMVEVFHDEKCYVWVKYQAIIDDLPILNITNREIIARHFSKLENCGLFEKYVKKQGGTFVCFKLIPEKYELLIDTRPKSREVSEAPYSKVEPLPYSKVETKDSSINLNSSTKGEPPENKIFKKQALIVKEYLKLYPNFMHLEQNPDKLIRYTDLLPYADRLTDTLIRQFFTKGKVKQKFFRQDFIDYLANSQKGGGALEKSTGFPAYRPPNEDSEGMKFFREMQKKYGVGDE